VILKLSVIGSKENPSQTLPKEGNGESLTLGEASEGLSVWTTGCALPAEGNYIKLS
jgi:hypothetical protein